tara:strand:+ start:1428 stop:2891 length:1464 start_codon:yes stop_codon:yes gene_type:complete
MDEGVMDFVDSEGLVSRQDWLEAVKKVLGDSDFDQVLVSDLLGGIRIEPLYTSDFPPASSNSSRGGPLPDTGVSRRSSNISGQVNGWEIRQKHWLVDPKKTNKSILEDLERGVNSIELIVGDGEETGLASALSGVLMDVAAIAPIGSGDNVETARKFLAYAQSSDVSEQALLADLSCDPIGALASQGGVIGGVESSLSKVGLLASDVSKSFKNVTAVRIDGTLYANAGADPVTELAAMISTGVAYLRALTDAGLSIEDAFRQILLGVSVGSDQFLDIAKIRALRELWRYIGDSCDVEETPARIQASTSSSMITKIDPWVNILRTTVGCFAAAIGGADLITIDPFDSAIGIPNDLGLRLARNTHLVLMEEANLHRVIDPAGGSWYIESLTDQLSELAWVKFQEIESNGGIVDELKAGNLQDDVLETKLEIQKRIADGDQVVVGVNQFMFDDGNGLLRETHPKLPDRSVFEDEVNSLQPYRQDEGFEKR